MSCKATTPESFWQQVDSSGGPDACWPWTGAKKPSGYGQVSVQYRVKFTHRYAWECTNGPIPKGLVVRHSCDNPPCCNPAHLLLGTHADNMADMASRSRAKFHRHPELIPRGEAQPQAKLTDDQVRELRRRRVQGAIYAELAQEFGISITTVCHIVNRKRWKHVA